MRLFGCIRCSICISKSPLIIIHLMKTSQHPQNCHSRLIFWFNMIETSAPPPHTHTVHHLAPFAWSTWFSKEFWKDLAKAKAGKGAWKITKVTNINLVLSLNNTFIADKMLWNTSLLTGQTILKATIAVVGGVNQSYLPLSSLFPRAICKRKTCHWCSVQLQEKLRKDTSGPVRDKQKFTPFSILDIKPIPRMV